MSIVKADVYMLHDKDHQVPARIPLARAQRTREFESISQDMVSSP